MLGDVAAIAVYEHGEEASLVDEFVRASFLRLLPVDEQRDGTDVVNIKIVKILYVILCKKIMLLFMDLLMMLEVVYLVLGLN